MDRSASHFRHGPSQQELGLSNRWVKISSAPPPLKLYPNHDFLGLRTRGVLAVRMAESVEQGYFGCSEGLQFHQQFPGCFDKKTQIFNCNWKCYQITSNNWFYSVISLIKCIFNQNQGSSLAFFSKCISFYNNIENMNFEKKRRVVTPF